MFLAVPGADDSVPWYKKTLMRTDELEDPFCGKPGVWHFASDHLESRLLFRGDADYRYGVNTLAIGCARHHKVSLLCYSLMSNHLHLLLKGIYADCLAYYGWVTRRLSMMVWKRDGVADVLRLGSVDVHAVLDNRQFRNEVAYISRNAYKARICSPFSYLWSSADVYFNPFRDALHGTRVEEMGLAAVRALFHTREGMPASYEHLDGRILNRCFVDYPYVERRLGDSLAFFDTLRVWDLESSVALSHGAAGRIAFSEEELLVRMTAICRQEYHTESVEQLDRKSLLLLARTLARRFGVGKTRLARLSGLSVDVLGMVL